MKRQSSLHLTALLAWFAFGTLPAGAADKTIELFNGKDYSNWRQPVGNWTAAGSVALNPAAPEKLAITPGTGVAVNGAAGKTVDLITKAEFGDAQVHIEFCIAKHSNSGIYFMGRYELQVYDSYGVEKDAYPGIECGGIYPRWINNKDVEGHSPLVNASKPPGEWQTFDVTFLAPRFDAAGKKIANAKFVKVLHNGKLIHANLELNAPTRGPMQENEVAAGPLRFQGDHGPVAYRNLTVTPLATP